MNTSYFSNFKKELNLKLQALVFFLAISINGMAQTVQLSVSANAATEAAATIITATATASAAVSGDQTVTIAASGTGITGTDYSWSGTTITILNGATAGSVTFTILDDADVEGTETATLTIANPSAGITLGATTTQDITITDNDFPSVQLSVSANAGTEAAGTVITATATASAAVSGDQTVTIAASGTGITGTDYSWSGTTITMVDGATTGSVTFTILDDADVEGTETATLTISNPSAGITLGATTTQNIIITDNDAVPINLSLSAGTRTEGNLTPITITATSTVPVTGAQSVDINITGTNITGGDYSLPSNTILIADNSTSGNVTITITDDVLFELLETLQLSFTNYSSGLIGGTTTTDNITITDNDTAPTVTLSASSPMAENGGNATVTATLSAIAGVDVTVNLDYSGTATGSGTDYSTSGNSILISSESGTLGTVTITGVDDAIDEGAETIIIDIISVTNGTESGVQQETISITDDDQTPSIVSVAIPNVAMNVNDVVTATITISDDGGDTHTLISGTVAGYNLGALTPAGAGVYTSQFTITDGGTDYAGTDDIPVSNLVVNDQGSNQNTPYTSVVTPQNGDPIDANIPQINSVTSVGSAAGLLEIGETITFTVTPQIPESGLIIAPTSYNGGLLTWSTTNGGTTYTATYTIANGHSDQSTPLQLTSVIITDPSGNTSPPASTSDVTNTIDANLPQISSVTSNIPTISDSDNGNQVIITITYNENMDNGTIPVISFPVENPLTTLTFNAGSSNWATATQYQAIYDIIDANENITDIDVQVAGGQDLAGNTQVIDASNTNVFSIDTQNPTTSNISVAGTVINTKTVINEAVSPTVNFVITFNEPMQGASTPAISFPVENALANGLSLNSGSWTAINEYTAVYNTTDLNVVLNDIDIQVTAANDAVGNAMSTYNVGDVFDINTANATATNISISSNPITDNEVGTETVSITVDFSEPMIDDNSQNPIIAFTPNISSEMTEVPAAATWPTTQQYIARYTIIDNDVKIIDIDIDVTGGQNATALNPITPAQSVDAFDLITQSPQIDNVTTVVTTGYYMAGEVIDIRVSYDQDVVVSVGTPTLTLNSGATVNYTGMVNSNTLQFTYTVLAGENTPGSDRLTYTTVNSLALNGGTIQSTAGIDAINTLPVIGGAGSMSDVEALFVDTIEPTALTLTPADDSFNYRVDGNFILQFNEDIQLTNNGLITIFDVTLGVTAFTFDMATATEVTLNGTNQIIINPPSDLNVTSQYYVLFDNTIILDLAGNQFAGYSTITDWNFVTFGPPIITSIVPEVGTAVCIGENLIINGSFLTGLTHVTFEGGFVATGSDVVVISDTEVRAIAPLNSLTGPIIAKKDNSTGNPEAEVKTDTLAITPNTIKLGPSSADLDFGSINNTTVCTSGTTTTSTIAIAITGGTGDFSFTYTAPNSLGVIGDINIANYTAGNDETIDPQYADNDNIFTLKTVTDAEGCDVPLTQISGSYTVRENTREVIDAGSDVLGLGEVSYLVEDVLDLPVIINTGDIDFPLITPPSTSSGAIIWSNPVSSDGIFNDTTLLNPTYTIGVNDLFNNSVDLTITTTDNPISCDAASDVLTINLVTAATATPEIAGGGSTFCWDGSPTPLINLDGSVGGGATGGLWERIPDPGDSEGVAYQGFDTGTVPDTTSTILDGTYLFTAFEEARGYADLTLTPTGGAGTPSAEPMTLSLSLVPTVNFNSPATSVCEGETGVLYSVADNVGSTYNWAVPTTGGTTFVGQGTSTVFIDWGTGATITGAQQQISVTETNSEGCSNNQFLDITVNPLPSVLFLTPQTNFTTANAPLILTLSSITSGSPADTIPLINSSDTIIFFSGQAVYKDSNDDWTFNPSLLIYDSITPSNNDYTISYSFTNSNGCISSGTKIFSLINSDNLITGLARAFCVYNDPTITLDPFLKTDEVVTTWELEEDRVLLPPDQTISSGLIQPNLLLFEYIFRPDSAGQYLNTSESRELFVKYSTKNTATGETDARGQLTTVFARPSLDFTLDENRICTTTNQISLEPGNTISAATGTFFEFTTNRPEPGVITYFSDPNDPLDKTKWKDFKLNIDALIVQDSINGDTLDIGYTYAEGNEFSIVCENTVTKQMVVYAQPDKPATPALNNTYCVTDLTNIPTASIINHLTGFNKDGDLVEARVIWTNAAGTEVSNDSDFTPNASQLPIDVNSFFVTQFLSNWCESETTEVRFINFTGVTYGLVNNCYDDSGTLRIAFPLGNSTSISRLDWEIQDLQGNTIQSFPNTPATQLIDLNVGTNFAPGGYNLILDLQTTSGCAASFTENIAVLESINVTGTNAYIEDFEVSEGGWVSESVFGISAWEYGQPNGNVINTALEGQNVWMTGLNPGYAAGTNTNLYSACFDISDLERPMIKIGTYYNTTSDDGAVIEYTNGTNLATATWSILGELETGDKWYNALNITANPGNQGTKQFGWSANTDSVWQESKHVLDGVSPALGNVILRVQFKSSSTNRPNFDGMAIDNVFIGNRTRTVLLENFSSTMQATATESENDAIRLLANNTSALAVIQYHPDVDGDDPLSTSADADARALYYGITTTPRVAIDGKAEADMLYTEWGKDEYSIRALNSSPLTIITTVTQNDDALEISSNITALENVPENFIVHTAIVANQLLASNYPAEQMLSGESNFNYVVQKMLPSASGQKFKEGLAQGDNITVTNTWSTSEQYASGTYSIIIFVQDEQSRVVYQTEIIEPTLNTVTGIEEELDLYGFAAYPNPANAYLTFKIKQEVLTDTKVEVYDQLGQLIYTTTLPKGRNQLEIKTVEWTSGIYYIQSELDGAPIRKRIMVQH